MPKSILKLLIFVISKQIITGRNLSIACKEIRVLFCVVFRFEMTVRSLTPVSHPLPSYQAMKGRTTSHWRKRHSGGSITFFPKLKSHITNLFPIKIHYFRMTDRAQQLPFLHSDGVGIPHDHVMCLRLCGNPSRSCDVFKALWESLAIIWCV